MSRTNVAGTTAPFGSGAQRCAQAGEREHRTESLALVALPSDLSARIKRDNETPHPMGPPLNRPPLTSDAISSDGERPAPAPTSQ